MDIHPTDAAGEPTRWLVCFMRRSPTWWANYIPGRFKHVRAFAYDHNTDCWVFYDPCLRTTIRMARGKLARHMMLEWADDAVVLAINPIDRQRVRFLPFCCTVAIASLLGMPGGALLPVTLHRQLLRNGAQIVDDESTRPATAGPDACSRTAAGTAG